MSGMLNQQNVSSNWKNPIFDWMCDVDVTIKYFFLNSFVESVPNPEHLKHSTDGREQVA